jgi:hypothetical protein
MPNTVAYLVFFSWPLVVFWILRRYPINKAIFIAVTTAYLLLPSYFEHDLPLLPPLNKESMSSLSLLVCLFLLRKKFKFFQPGLIVKIFIGYLIVIVMSCELNGSVEMIGGKVLPGLSHYDALSEIIRTLLWIVPFFLGRYFFSDVKDNEGIFKILVILAIVYSIPMLYEIRFSPQLNRIIYGYYATDFIQSIRGDGFRASVLVGHGLPLAFWISTSMLAAMALHKNKVRLGKFPASLAVYFLAVVLVLSKTWSALIYAIIGIIFIYRLSPSKQIKLSLLLASFIMLYPVTKIIGVFPDKEIISTIAEYNTERAESMKTRYVNEEQLLTHALEKPFFGWSGYGRNRIFDESGKDISITDGKWVLQFGVYGAFGFVFYYLMLLTPIYFALKYIRYIDNPKDQVYFALLSIFLAICIIDSVPNTNMGTMNWLFAGALMGQAEFLKKQRYLLIKERASQSWIKKTS